MMKVSPPAIRARLDDLIQKWRDELPFWFGTTAGVTLKGTPEEDQSYLRRQAKSECADELAALVASLPEQESPAPYGFRGGIPSQCSQAHPEPPHHRCHFDSGHEGPHETRHGRWEGEYPNGKPLVASLGEPQGNEWKDAVIDALIVNFILSAEHYTNPQKALADLVTWETKIALDPAVSKEAHDLHERIKQLEAELASRPPGVGWQPIETASKDGTTFIAANRFDAFKAFYDTEQEAWVGEDDGQWFGALQFPPTHWMPLPPPPAGDAP